jgi:hypothetical protein
MLRVSKDKGIPLLEGRTALVMYGLMPAVLLVGMLWWITSLANDKRAGFLSYLFPFVLFIGAVIAYWLIGRRHMVKR